MHFKKQLKKQKNTHPRKTSQKKKKKIMQHFNRSTPSTGSGFYGSSPITGSGFYGSSPSIGSGFYGSSPSMGGGFYGGSNGGGGMVGRKGVPKGVSGAPSVHLPKDVYAMFESKDKVVHWKPKQKRMVTPMMGMGKFVKKIKLEFTPKRWKGPVLNENDQRKRMIGRRYELKELERDRRMAKYAQAVQRRLIDSHYDPLDNPQGNEKKTSDGFKTLFVTRLSKDTTEEELEDFMKQYGHVVNTRVVRDLKNVSKRYAFVEFDDDKALQRAFRQADGASLKGAHILVDVERARTVSTWVPRRFGGGLGGPVTQKGYTLHRGRGELDRPKPLYFSGGRRR